MKIYLIRHGETTGDIEDRIGGSYDDHLTEKGHEQLKKTAEKLVDEGIEIIFSSPLIRAQESASIIARKLHCPIETVERLKERHYGVITGLKRDEAKAKYPEAIARHGDPAYTHPDGESYTDFYNRVIDAFRYTAMQGYQNLAILGHGGSLKCILKFLQEPIPDKIEDGEILKLLNVGIRNEINIVEQKYVSSIYKEQ
jgi:broad specificity phosphatase PhoE